MAPRRSTRHGASASTRRTAGKARSGRGSASRTRASGARSSASRPSSSRRTPARTAPRQRGRTGLKLAGLLVGAALLLGWAFYSPLKIHYQESREQARLEAELESLKERNEALNAQVERLRTPEGVEEVARESLGMVKPGENLYLLVEPDESGEEPAASPAPMSAEEAASRPVWTVVLDFLFGVR